jgi:hypothetical protein
MLVQGRGGGSQNPISAMTVPGKTISKEALVTINPRINLIIGRPVLMRRPLDRRAKLVITDSSEQNLS